MNPTTLRDRAAKASLRSNNEQRLLELLCCHTEITTDQIAVRTGMTLQVISMALRRMEQRSLVTCLEVGTSSHNGRWCLREHAERNGGAR